MASEYIASIIGGGAEEEIKSAIAQLDILAKRIVEINQSVAAMQKYNIQTGNSGGSKETLAQLNQIKEMQKEMMQMDAKIVSLQNQITQARTRQTKALSDEDRAIIENQKNKDANIKTTIRAQKSIEQLTRARQQEEAEIAKQNNAYEQLKAEYAESANATKKLLAEYYNLQRSGTATAEQLQQMAQAARTASKETLGLHKAVFDIEQATGQSQRNVGNYNALMFETNQLLREAPNFALSARTGFMALSNNLPMFAEQFSNVAKSIDETTGKVKGWGGALKEVGASILSWQTLLIVGITLLLQYGDKIGDFFSGISDAERKAKEANDEYVKSLRDVETQSRNTGQEQISRMNILVGVAQDVNQKMDERLDAVNALRNEFPAYFKDLGNEAVLYGDLTKQINETTNALYHKALADAYQGKAAKAADLYVQQRMDLDDLTNSIAKYYSENEKAIKIGKETSKAFVEAQKAGANSNAFTNLKDVQIATKYDDMLKQRQTLLGKIGDTQKEIFNFQKGAVKEAEQAGGMFIDSATQGTAKSPRTPDTTNAELKAMDELAKARAALNKAQIEADASANKAIADNESNILEQRLDAYTAYTQDKIKLYELESGLEIEATKNRLDKIAEIEAKPASKRTAQEKKLLLQKQYLSELLETLEKEHQLKLDQITDDAQKERNNIIVNNLRNQRAIVQQAYKDVSDNIKLEVNKQLAALNESYDKGEMSYKEYNRRRVEITADGNKQIYEAEKQMLNNELNNSLGSLKDSNLTPEEKQAITAKVNAIYELIAGLQPPKTAEKENPILKALGISPEQYDFIKQHVKELINSVFDLISARRDAYYQNKFDILDEDKDRMEANFQAEKDGINSSLLSQEEKQKRLDDLDAQQAAKEKAYDAQNKQLQRQQAQAEKRDAEFKIAIDGAVAIGQVFKQFGWPAGIIPAAAMAVITATQLAAVAARPIPQYATGIDDHPGGLAVVGEKGRELVNLPSGQSFVTPDMATIMNLPKHTEVVPHKELLDRAHLMALNKVNMINQPVTPNDYSQALIGAFEQNIKRLESTIKNKQEVHFFWKNGELRKSVNRGGQWTHHIGDS